MMFSNLHSWRPSKPSRKSRRGAKNRRKALQKQRGRLTMMEQLEDRRMLATFMVNSTFDAVDANPGDGFALDASGNTTLRAAVMEANALAGDDTIQLGSGTYPLSIAGTGAAATGDLDITDTSGSLTITGAGAGTTIIDAGGATGLNDRVFKVLAGVVVNVAEVTVTGGEATGGGFLNFGTLTFTNTTVSGNSGSSGGGVRNAGALTLLNSTLSGNTSSSGGGIYNRDGDVSIINSTITANTATASFGGGGIKSTGSDTVIIIGSTISDNVGGGIRSSSNVVWTITDTTISGNTGNGGISGGGSFSIAESIISDNTGGSAGISGNGPLTIVNSMIVRNTGHNSGGISIGGGSTVTITGSTISDNVGQNSGGINNSDGDVSIIDSVIAGNTGAGSSSRGGGIRTFRGTLTLFNTIVSGNYASSAGAIQSNATVTSLNTVTITDSTIIGNESASRNIVLEGGTNTFLRSTIADNTGGGIWSGKSGVDTFLAVIDSTISGNSKIAIRSLFGGTLMIDNSTISGNSQGLVMHQLGAATINNSTITDNLSGGISKSSTNTINVKNSIIARNTGYDVDASGMFNSLGNNLIGDVSLGHSTSDIGSDTGFTDGVNGDQVGGDGNPVIDPQLAPLQDNGGPTFTHALLPGSPAIDAASSTDASGAPITADQRGITRPQGVANDIGAFELEVTNVPPTADAGGPYTVAEGGSIQLDASASTDPDQDPTTLTFEWDLDNDGVFGETGAVAAQGDEVGVNPIFSAAGLDGPGVVNVDLRVTDDGGLTDEDTISINITNVAPVAADQSYSTLEDMPISFNLLTGTDDSGPFDVTDPGTLDTHTAIAGTFATAAGGSVTIAASGNATYTPAASFAGQDTFSFTAVDDDDGSGTATVTVTVRNLVDFSGRVFDDLNNDGLFNGSDVGLGGATVELFNETDLFTPIATETTDADGQYTFDANLGEGEYRIVETQPTMLLDGVEMAGDLGGTVDNTQDNNDIRSITVASGDSDADGYNFADIQPSRIQGLVWEDFNNDGEVNFGEKAIEDVAIALAGIDDRGNAVLEFMDTDAQGIFEFINLRPSDAGGYTLTETQPVGFIDGEESLGTVDGLLSGVVADNVFSQIGMSVPSSDAINYNFGERSEAGGTVQAGQAATIGFWQNKNGQNLVKSLNGGENATQLGNWLATTFPNMYGASAGPNNLGGLTNEAVAGVFKTLFKRNGKTAVADGPPKLDAQVMATAFAVYVTNETLAGTTAADFGFLVTEYGIGASMINIGQNGAAFDVADNAELTVLDILLKTDERTSDGLLFDLNDDDTIDDFELTLRLMANAVYTDINEQGDI